MSHAQELPPAELQGTFLDRALDRSGKVLAWLSFLAMVISVYEVFMRYGLSSPTLWVHETVTMLVAVTFAIGGPVAMARDEHIRVRILYDTVGPQGRRWLDLLNGLLTILFCVGMSYAAYIMFWRASHNPMGEWQLQRSGTSWNPPFPALIKGVILLSLVLMTLQSLLHTARAIKALVLSFGKGR